MSRHLPTPSLPPAQAATQPGSGSKTQLVEGVGAGCVEIKAATDNVSARPHSPPWKVDFGKGEERVEEENEREWERGEKRRNNKEGGGKEKERTW